MNSEDVLDVCIVGSGVAGLSAAISLQRCGVRVKVYEKDFDFNDRKQGYGMTLTHTITGPLAILGILDECILKNCPSHCHYVFNPVGDVLGYYGREFKQKADKTMPSVGGGNQGNLRIPRQDLRLMLIQQLKAGTIIWGKTIEDYKEDENLLTISFATQSSCRGNERILEHQKARILVGADGLRSTVRRLRDEKVKASIDSPLRYLGVSVIIGLSKVSHPHVDSRGFYVIDGEHRLFTMPYAVPNPSSKDKEPGITMWQLSFSNFSESQAHDLRHSSEHDLIQLALTRTTGWLDPVKDLIQNTISGEIWAAGLYDRDPMILFPKGTGSRVTVIGDACHPMSMFKGQGANQSLADGPLLAHWLVSHVQAPKKQKVSHLPIRKEVLLAAPAAPATVFCNREISTATTGSHKILPKKKEELKKDEEKGEEEAPHDSRALSLEMTGEAPPGPGPGRSAMKNSLEPRGTIGAIGAIGAATSNDMGNFSDIFRNQNSVYTKLRCFEREMVSRSSPKVLASREAATMLHSTAALDEVFGIAGWASLTANATENRHLLQSLRSYGINAKLGADLDRSMKAALDSYMHSCLAGDSKD